MLALEEAPTRRLSSSRAFRSCVPSFLAAVVVLTFFALDVHRATPAITGDEPSYLAFADALTHGTFDVRAAYEDPSGPRRWLPGLAPDQVVVHAGHLRSIRLPLLPLLLTPAMALGSLALARLTMVALAVLVMDQLWRLLGDLDYRGLARAGPWLATLTALPMLGYATHIYPEIAGALCIVVIVRLLVRRSRRSLVAASMVAGLLPWLILRFAVLALALWIAATLISAQPQRWRAREVATALHDRWRDAAIVAAPGVASTIAFVGYIRVLYGSFDPRVVYPPAFTQAWTPWHAYVEGIGSLFGAGEGLIPYAPAFLIGLVGVVAAARRYRTIGWFLLGVAAIHLFIVVPTGFWGLALPGRFVIVLVPLLAIAMAEALRTAPVLDVVVLALVAVQLVIVGLYHDINVLILDRIPHYSYLAMFPAVDDEPGLANFGLSVTHNPGPVARVDAGSLRADRARGAGVVYTSPGLTLRPGRYRTTLQLAASGTPSPNANLARITITQLPQHRVLAERAIRSLDLTTPIDLAFDAPHQPVRWTNRVVIQVATIGTADLELGKVSGGPTTPLRPRDRVIHDDIPLAVTWLCSVTLGGGLLLFRPGRRRTRHRGQH